MTADERVILIVEQDDEVRSALGEWIERPGYRVVACPGPRGPTYTCIGSDRGRCPLARGADLVLLDMWLAGEAAMLGASSLDLLTYYLADGHPVIALIHGPDPTELFLDERLTILEWPPDRRDLLETIRALAPLPRAQETAKGSGRGRRRSRVGPNVT